MSFLRSCARRWWGERVWVWARVRGWAWAWAVAPSVHERSGPFVCANKSREVISKV
ncbi:hypothetical protein HETIRDRAFT_440645 [Heterobasidion irregulare TC 32-1]|uniref:Uncharacterized protein n=1 Tax=Heterobasidion irregulare (strain TC 32-1) TaxID=747525 RepID=W4K735_HETIT|nr:uncharacterized protein HETIRDRAFT_440645 [Heterobasidion irregulare TC 32-1]ETW81155.1 hypothetical protein HETIRDRAFT_440645 [Heterobasidion irregulare TC 32-1]